MKISTSLAAAAWLSFSSVCIAQVPPGVTAEMIASALPEEGAPKAESGSYAITVELAFGESGLKTFRPTSLGAFPGSDTLPVVVWGNGGCAVNNARYDGFLSTIASHGFLVITTTAATLAAAPAAGAPPARVTAETLKAAIDWAERENARGGSPLRGKIHTQQVAVMGQSCGGALSIAIGADQRVGTIGVFNAGLADTALDQLGKLHGPVLLINGHERDFMFARSKANYDAIDTLPAFYGARHGAGHTATAYHAGGGEFANVASSWVRWVFKGDSKAGALFEGQKCGLCTNPHWDAEGKRLEKRR